tara:strand:+ start:6744 stop:7625 length:882 start_codon:yes stop_codon:yes gene_type:complete
VVLKILLSDPECKMNLLFTGSKGFISQELINYFSEKKHQLLTTDRTTLDPRSMQDVENFFKNNKIDVVIHTAIKGGKRNQPENVNDLFDNLAMFNNLSKFADEYNLMINFGSGAAFDRECNIHNAVEKEIFNCLPADYYGLSKNLIARKIALLDSNIYNLRLFGCFGIQEEPQRLCRASFNNLMKGEGAIIHQDKYMDYFYAQDVGKVVEFLIENVEVSVPKDINLCYTQKTQLSDLAKKIKYLTMAKSNVIIENETMANSYTGCSKALDSLNIQLYGLEKGIRECIVNWTKF